MLFVSTLSVVRGYIWSGYGIIHVFLIVNENTLPLIWFEVKIVATSGRLSPNPVIPALINGICFHYHVVPLA